MQSTPREKVEHKSKDSSTTRYSEMRSFPLTTFGVRTVTSLSTETGTARTTMVFVGAPRAGTIEILAGKTKSFPELPLKFPFEDFDKASLEALLRDDTRKQKRVSPCSIDANAPET